MKRWIGACALLAGLLALSCSYMDVADWNAMSEKVFHRVEDAVWGVFDACDGVVGTAFIVKHDGTKYLVTCEHVLHGYDLSKMKFSREERDRKLTELPVDRLEDVRIVFSDHILDIAVLTAKGIESLPCLELSPHEHERVRIFAVGLAKAQDYLGMSITEGSISNPTKEIIATRTLQRYHIEHTALYVGGQSGGPLVDMEGRVLGVNSFATGDRPTLNFYYAVPLLQAFREMNEKGRLEIRNEGIARIDQVYVSPHGGEPAGIDVLPPNVGKINGGRRISFGIDEGAYTVTLIAEDHSEPVTHEVRIEKGQSRTITHAHGSTGFLFVNGGCKIIRVLCVFDPDTGDLIDGIKRDTDLSSVERREQVNEIFSRRDVLGMDMLHPGQIWLQYCPPGTYWIHASLLDVERQQMEEAEPIIKTVPKQGLTEVQLAPE